MNRRNFLTGLGGLMATLAIPIKMVAKKVTIPIGVTKEMVANVSHKIKGLHTLFPGTPGYGKAKKEIEEMKANAVMRVNSPFDKPDYIFEEYNKTITKLIASYKKTDPDMPEEDLKRECNKFQDQYQLPVFGHVASNHILELKDEEGNWRIRNKQGKWRKV